MRANDPNLPHLRHIAQALGALREQVVFVGGAVAGLLVTDPLASSVRATRDVDAVVHANRTTFHRIEEAVAACGFARNVGSEVICRWVHKASGVVFDLMPVQPEVLGVFQPLVPLCRADGASRRSGARRGDSAGERGGLCSDQAGSLCQPRGWRLSEQPRPGGHLEHRRWARGANP